MTTAGRLAAAIAEAQRLRSALRQNRTEREQIEAAYFRALAHLAQCRDAAMDPAQPTARGEAA